MVIMNVSKKPLSSISTDYTTCRTEQHISTEEPAEERFTLELTNYPKNSIAKYIISNLLQLLQSNKKNGFKSIIIEDVKVEHHLLVDCLEVSFKENAGEEKLYFMKVQVQKLSDPSFCETLKSNLENYFNSLNKITSSSMRHQALELSKVNKHEKAFSLFLEAIKCGDEESAFNVAEYLIKYQNYEFIEHYVKEITPKIIMNEAHDFFLNYANSKLNSVEAILKIINCLMNNVPQYIGELQVWFLVIYEKLEDKQGRDKLSNLGKLYFQTLINKGYIEEACKICNLEPFTSLPSIRLLKGVFHQLGLFDYERNYSQAIKFYEQAAIEGDELAAYLCRYCVLIKKCTEQVLQWEKEFAPLDKDKQLLTTLVDGNCGPDSIRQALSRVLPNYNMTVRQVRDDMCERIKNCFESFANILNVLLEENPKLFEGDIKLLKSAYEEVSKQSGIDLHQLDLMSNFYSDAIRQLKQLNAVEADFDTHILKFDLAKLKQYISYLNRDGWWISVTDLLLYLDLLNLDVEIKEASNKILYFIGEKGKDKKVAITLDGSNEYTASHFQVLIVNTDSTIRSWEEEDPRTIKTVIYGREVDYFRGNRNYPIPLAEKDVYTRFQNFGGVEGVVQTTGYFTKPTLTRPIGWEPIIGYSVSKYRSMVGKMGTAMGEYRLQIVLDGGIGKLIEPIKSFNENITYLMLGNFVKGTITEGLIYRMDPNRPSGTNYFELGTFDSNLQLSKYGIKCNGAYIQIGDFTRKNKLIEIPVLDTLKTF